MFFTLRNLVSQIFLLCTAAICPIFCYTYATELTPPESTSALPMRFNKEILFITLHLECGGGERAFVDMLHFLPLTNKEYDVCIMKRGGSFERFLPADTNFVTMEQAQLRRYRTVVAFVAGVPLEEWLKIPAERRAMWIHNDLSSAPEDCWIRNAEICLPINVLVGVSDAATNSFKKVNPLSADKIQTIHNFVNIKKIRKKATKPQGAIVSTPGIVNVVTVSRLSPEKGIDRAIQVHKRLNDEGINFRWFVVGSGPISEELQQQVNVAGLQGKFIFLGLQMNPYPYMKAADIFVLPSRSEAAPIVLTEALSLMRPIVSTNVGDASQQISSGVNGLVVDDSDEALYQGLKSLILDQRLRTKFSKKLKKFTYDNKGIVKKLMRLFQIHHHEKQKND